MPDPSQDSAVRVTDAVAVDALLALSPDAVLVIDTTGVILQVNSLASDLFRCEQARLLGLEVESLLPQQLRHAHRDDRQGFHDAPSRRHIGSGRHLLARRLDSTTFSADISLQPVSVAGQLLVIALVRDLTTHDELRRRNDDLARDTNALRRFIDVASHELRTPLTSVLGFAETLKQQPDMPTDMRDTVLDRLLGNAQRQHALLGSLLDMSRLHNGKLAVSIAPVDLQTTVRNVCVAFERFEINCTVPPGILLLADGLRVEQILGNLLTNAVRYGEPPITIQAGSVDGSGDARAWLRVSDQGPGVDKGFEVSLFEAFSQQSTGDRREATGLGLGLYLCRELADAMDGSIDYLRPESGGSCFELRLPTA